MDKILKGREGVVCMMDNVLVLGRDDDAHDRTLEKLLRRLEESGMSLNKRKCELG